MMSKRKEEEMKTTLTTAQEVLYSREFRRADKAGGYTQERRRK